MPQYVAKRSVSVLPGFMESGWDGYYGPQSVIVTAENESEARRLAAVQMGVPEHDITVEAFTAP